jgi:hypothetical protein
LRVHILPLCGGNTVSLIKITQAGGAAENIERYSFRKHIIGRLCHVVRKMGWG